MSDKIWLIRVLETAVNAPSGDNTQPWRFRIQNNELFVYNLEDRDTTIYNFKQRGSYLGHGALVENIVIAASAEGYSADVTPFPGEPKCTAHISFRKGALADPLHAHIERRTTNRKPYVIRPLRPEDKARLHNAASGFSDVTLKFVEGNEVVTRLGRLVGVNERILFEHRGLHDFLFSIIRWTPKEELSDPGLYVKTMEFPLPLQYIMRYIFYHWPVVRVLNMLGLSKVVSAQSSANHAACSAFGAIVIKGYENVDFFCAGRALERVWLQATALDVSMQPVTALPYLMQRVREGEANMFDDAHINRIKKTSDEISKLCGLQEGEHIAMLFRIGYGGAPSAHSHKQTPVILN